MNDQEQGEPREHEDEEREDFERRFPQFATLQSMDDEQLVSTYNEALQRLRHELDGIEG